MVGMLLRYNQIMPSDNNELPKPPRLAVMLNNTHGAAFDPQIQRETGWIHDFTSLPTDSFKEFCLKHFFAQKHTVWSMSKSKLWDINPLMTELGSFLGTMIDFKSNQTVLSLFRNIATLRYLENEIISGRIVGYICIFLKVFAVPYWEGHLLHIGRFICGWFLAMCH